tara:strand:- start:907 stop:1500 length:594 start_codon:yes stop_codon:yes gene_type:complete
MNFFEINRKRICSFHLNHIYVGKIIKIQKAYRDYKFISKNIIYIQTIYRGYRCRNKLNYFYKRLPNDIQYLIKYYINKELYEKRKQDKIKTIINRKLSAFNIEMINLFDTNVLFIDEFLKFENKILNNFNLVNKYNELIVSSNRKIYYNLDLIITEYIRTIHYYNDYNSSNIIEIEFKKIRLDIILGMLNYYNSSEC